MAVRLTQLQVVSPDDYAARGVAQRLRAIVLPAERGSIFDRNGSELAMSVRRHTVWADPRLVTDPEGAADALAPVLGVDHEVLVRRLGGSGAFVYLSRQVDADVAETVSSLGLDGVSLLDESHRFTPAGSLAASVLGTVDIDNQGTAGLELVYEDRLVGVPGELILERGPGGRTIAAGEHRLSPAERGDDLVLTIDRSLQYEVERALGDQILATGAAGGSAIVMDPRTGEILALANLRADAAGGPPRPSRDNMAVTTLFEPGSVSKVVVAAAALEEGLYTPEQTWEVPPAVQVSVKRFSDEHPRSGPSSFTDVITRSSNVGTIQIGQALGPERVDAYLRRFGFGQSTGLGFPGESNGILLDLDEWTGPSIGSISIGQGIAVNALQMLGAFNAIANDGVLVTPTLVRSTLDADGTEHLADRSPRRRVISAASAEQMRAILTNVVASTEGTGQRAQIAGYSVAGKTGTARKPSRTHRGYEEGAYVATFAGFVPAEDPQLSAIVVLDEPSPYYASLTSAPVFGGISRYALRLLRIPPSATPIVEPPVVVDPDTIVVPRD
ncbi:MAG TPA: penicillin-binding protein 2 [Acidimicrobiales bacterium]|nr:penicillin-binding protein 2 [Acidimicrobiales bacterium]